MSKEHEFKVSNNTALRVFVVLGLTPLVLSACEYIDTDVDITPNPSFPTETGVPTEVASFDYQASETDITSLIENNPTIEQGYKDIHENALVIANQIPELEGVTPRIMTLFITDNGPKQDDTLIFAQNDTTNQFFLLAINSGSIPESKSVLIMEEVFMEVEMGENGKFESVKYFYNEIDGSKTEFLKYDPENNPSNSNYLYTTFDGDEILFNDLISVTGIPENNHFGGKRLSLVQPPENFYNNLPKGSIINTENKKITNSSGEVLYVYDNGWVSYSEIINNAEQILEAKSFQLKEGVIYNQDQVLGNHIYRDGSNFLELEVEGAKYELNVENLVHTLPKEGETHLWFNEDIKDAVWGSEIEQGKMLQMRNGEWEVNSLEVNWPDSLNDAIKIVDPDQIDVYMDANYERYMNDYESGEGRFQEFWYNVNDGAHKGIGLWFMNKEFQRDRRTGIFQLDLKWIDPTGVTWTDNQFSIFPSKIYYTANDDKDYMVTIKLSAFSKNLNRSDDGRIEYSEMLTSMHRGRIYAEKVMTDMKFVASNENYLVLIKAAASSEYAYLPFFITDNLLPEYFIITQLSDGNMSKMQEFNESLEPLTETSKKIFKDLLLVFYSEGQFDNR